MKPGYAYIHEFKNIEGKTVTTTIYDTFFQVDDDMEVILVTLAPAGDPLHISTEDNNEDKFTPTKSKRATIKFLSDSNTNLETFSSGPDDRFYVTIQIENQFIFYGFLMLDDQGEPFLPPTNEVTLTANDRLKALKDIDLTDDDLVTLRGKHRIADILAYCLKKTRLTLGIKVINNLRHGTGQMQYQATFDATNQTVTVSTDSGFFYEGMEIETSGTTSNNSADVVLSVADGSGTKILTLDRTITSSEAGVTTTFTDISSEKHFYDGIYLDAKTFEQEIGTCENCLQVIEKILGEDCFLTQWKGEWWVMRVDEFDGNPPYLAQFSADGVFGGFLGAADFDKEIGFNESIWLSQEQTNVVTQREHGFVKEIFRYQHAKEIPCNSDFARGVGPEPDLFQNGDLDFTPECWTLFREGDTGTNASIDSQPVSGSLGVLRKTYEIGYEREKKFIVVNAASGGRHYLKSEAIEVEKNGRLEISVDTRFDTNLSIINVFPALIRLEGNDGTLWDWEYNESDGTNEWVEVFSSTGSFLHQWQYNRANDDTREWRTISATSKSIPVSGEVFIRLVMGSAQPNQIWFNNLRVTNKAYIQGSYQEFSGQFNRVDRTDIQGSGIKSTGYLAKRENEVYLSDSPNRFFKGTMFYRSRGVILYSGSVQFAVTGFSLTGNVIAKYPSGQIIYISGTNSGYYTVVSSTFNIVGGTTAVVTSPAPPTVITETATIRRASFRRTVAFFTSHAFGQSFPPGPEYCIEYGKTQAFAVWNQYRNTNKIFQYSFQGDKTLIGFGEVPPDLLNKFFITDSSTHSNNRHFMMLTFDHDLFLCESKGTLVETYRTDIPKMYGDVFEFKYISDKT